MQPGVVRLEGVRTHGHCLQALHANAGGASEEGPEVLGPAAHRHHALSQIQECCFLEHLFFNLNNVFIISFGTI